MVEFGDDLGEAYKNLDKIAKTLEKMNKLLATNLKHAEKLSETFKEISDLSQTAMNKGLQAKQSHATQILEERLRGEERLIKVQAEYEKELENLRAGHVKENKILIHNRKLMEEEHKTRRAKMDLLKKSIGQFGGKGLFDASNIIGMGTSYGMAGLMGAGEKGEMGMGGLQQRILNYQTKMSQNKMGTPTQTPLHRFPNIENMFYGKRSGNSGQREGGILGGLAGGVGKAAPLMGLLGGGAAGLVGGIIMKGLESSPMFQSMSKILNQAFSFYFRPIGDFVGGVIKPIATVMLKQGAIAMKSGTNAVKYGEMIGKGMVAIFTNPAGFMQSAWVTLIRSIDEWWHNSVVNWFYGILEPIKEVPLFGDMIKGLIGTKQTEPYKSDYGAKEGVLELGSFIDKTYTDLNKELNDKLKELSSSTNTAIKDYMSTTTGQQTPILKIIQDSSQSMSTNVKSTMDNLNRLPEQLLAAQRELAAKYNVTTYDTKGNVTYSPTSSSLEKLKGTSKTPATAQAEKDFAASVDKWTTYMSKTLNQIGLQKVGLYQTQGQTKIREGGSAEEVMGWFAQQMFSGGVNKMANGGIINEPIFGIGKSGKKYMFGERGSETVSPNGSSSSTVININISNMSGSRDDVQKLRQEILNVLQSVNSSRGR